jgi:glucan phosphoethanolaminetransferase (alkaline phosphatase superfamily)
MYTNYSTRQAYESEAGMVKKTSYVFVILLTTIILLVFSTVISPQNGFLVTAINYNAVALLLCGIVLIIALIVDRYNDYKNENDDYKKY